MTSLTETGLNELVEMFISIHLRQYRQDGPGIKHVKHVANG